MDICEIEYEDIETPYRHPWELARKRFILFLIKQYENKVNHSDEFVDIGCGDCFLVNFLAQHFSTNNFWAIDSALSDEINSIVSNNITSENVKIYNNLDNLFRNCSKKHLMLFDVLEHIEDEKKFISSLQKMNIISSGSIMFITVPAFKCFFSEHDKKLKHFRRYSIRDLKELVEEFEFEPLEYSYFFFTLIIIRILHKYKRLSNATPGLKWKYSKNSLITRIIRFILYADARICRFLSKLKITIPGLSCYIICQKL